MSAGLPGLGLSGLFVLLSALCAPIAHLIRSSRTSVRPTRILPLFLLAMILVIVIIGIWDGLVFVVGAFSSGDAAHAHGGSIPVLLISLAILGTIVATAAVAARLITPRLTPIPPPIPFHSDVEQDPDDPPKRHGARLRVAEYRESYVH